MRILPAPVDELPHMQCLGELLALARSVLQLHANGDAKIQPVSDGSGERVGKVGACRGMWVITLDWIDSQSNRNVGIIRKDSDFCNSVSQL